MAKLWRQLLREPQDELSHKSCSTSFGWALLLSHSVLPCLFWRFTLGTGASRLGLLTVLLSPDVESGVEAEETLTNTWCQLWQKGVVFGRHQGRQMRWSKPLLSDSQQLIIMAAACGMPKVPASLVSSLWKWICTMAGTPLEHALLSVLWVDAQIVWDLHGKWIWGWEVQDAGYHLAENGFQKVLCLGTHFSTCLVLYSCC